MSYIHGVISTDNIADAISQEWDDANWFNDMKSWAKVHSQLLAFRRLIWNLNGHDRSAPICRDLTFLMAIARRRLASANNH